MHFLCFISDVVFFSKSDYAIKIQFDTMKFIDWTVETKTKNKKETLVTISFILVCNKSLQSITIFLFAMTSNVSNGQHVGKNKCIHTPRVHIITFYFLLNENCILRPFFLTSFYMRCTLYVFLCFNFYFFNFPTLF